MSIRKKNKRNGQPKTNPNLKVSSNSSEHAAGTNLGKGNDNSSVKLAQIAPALVDFSSILAMVLGGCCSNVLVYERLLLMNPRIGSALTFSQMLFITLQSLPSFLVFSPKKLLPRLKPRQVPLGQWGLQVVVLTTGSLLNNWAYAYKVPLTVLIVFRSAGLPVSMLFGSYFLKRNYNFIQIASVVMVTAGAFLSTLSRSSPSSAQASELDSAQDLRLYLTGLSMLVVSLFCTGFLGLLQERTYGKYGPCWREGVFYTHFLSLPAFLFLGADIKQGIVSLSGLGPGSSSAIMAYLILLGNLVTQLICVSGVNQLSSRVSSVSTNIALTARKALSLCFSVWWFGNDWNFQLGLGATMVFIGSLLYAVNSDKEKDKKK